MALPANNSNTGKHHILMLPFIAQGHLIPFLNLSVILAKRSGFTVTILSTPHNILSLRRRIECIPDTEALDIRLKELPFSSADHGLPPNTENTDSLPPHLVTRFIISFKHVQPHLEQLIASISEGGGRPPLCMISDWMCGWTLDVARKFGIPRITFCVSSALAVALSFSLFLHRTHFEAQSEEYVTLPDLPHISLRRSQISAFLTIPGESEEDGTSSVLFFADWTKKNINSWGMMFNTVEALDRSTLQHFRSTTGRPVWSVGPLSILSSLTPSLEAKASAACLQWLDSHPPASVLYICFGSQNSISAGNMKELALGLESAGQPFVWVVRPPLGFPPTIEFSAEFLPDGFEEKIIERKQGLIIKGWSPQVMILSHPSTGGFLTHCGWGSVMESLMQGVPLLGWPLVRDQYFTSVMESLMQGVPLLGWPLVRDQYFTCMLSEELGVGVELSRDLKGEVRKEEVERNVRMLMEEQKGLEMRTKAMHIKGEIIKAVCEGKNGEQKGSSIRDIDDLVDKLVCGAN